MKNLLEVAPTLLDEDPAIAPLSGGVEPRLVAAAEPASSLVWAILAEQALEAGDDIASYAYARVGYHRGLDHLRRAGWRGAGPIPWEHEPNRGFLRAVAALGRAAHSIQEDAEANRCRDFLTDCGAPDVPELAP